MKFAPVEISQRFWPKVDKRDDHSCWHWQASKDGCGYGIVGYRGKVWKAHRVAYVLTFGEIPKGQCVCHSCDNPACCNPRHLWLGSHTENMADMTAKGRRPRNTGQKGVKHHSAVLSEADVLAIYRGSDNQGVVANKYGVCQSLISGIRTGKRWGHLTGKHNG